jgi:HAD superfamily hydrolase (TIGR01457 family)
VKPQDPPPAPSPTQATTSPYAGPVLADRYDALLIDLDGVVYRGDQVIRAAAATLPQVRRRGSRVLFLTNNSARTPGQVAEKLRDLGIAAEPGDVLTSAVATAAMLRREGTTGRTAFVIGERGIREALEQAGIELLDGEPERTDLVVVGWDRAVDYAKLRTASLLVERGARLIATNADASYPAPDGLWPGAGAILAAVTTTTGAEPLIVGKPSRPLFEAAAEATGADNPLMVGDRLETDVGGAASMGWDSLLVLSGAARSDDLLRSSVLPTYVGADLRTLLDDVPRVRLRTAAEGDASNLQGLLTSSGLRADGAGDRLEQTVVAELREEPGTIVATASLEELEGTGDAVGPAARRGILRSVAVRPDLRGKGLGQLVTAGAITTGRATGITEVFLFTETAERFFQRLGFRTVDRDGVPSSVTQTAHVAEECPTAVAMTLDL